MSETPSDTAATTVSPDASAVQNTASAGGSPNVERTAPPVTDGVQVSVDELLVGRPLEFPIYNDQGVLLLAEGSVITSEFKRLIRSRGDIRLRINAADVSRVTTRGITADKSQNLSFDTELSKKLDAIIEGGLLPVSNRGPAVRNNLVYLGKKAYDPKQRDDLLQMHDRNSKALGQMMNEAMHGGYADGSLVAMMAADYLKQMTTDVDNTLTSAIEKFDDANLSMRSVEVSLLTMALGIEMGLDASNVRDLGVIGLVHDWGMMKVPQEIVRATRILTASEFLQIQKHPIYSLEILQRVSSLPSAASIVAYQIHEQIGGEGYPRQRKGKSIHLFARTIQVADAYIAMTTPRPYRPPMMPYAAMECIVRMAKEKRLDGDIVKALLKVMCLFPLKSFVLLSDQSLARVLRRNGDHYTAPIVQRVQDGQGNPVDENDPANILNLQTDGLSVVEALPTPGSLEIPLKPEFIRLAR